MKIRSLCAVIPAAGQGSRLGVAMPKILVPVDGQRTIWTVLRDKLLPYVDHIHVILSPSGHPLFQEAMARDPTRHLVSSSIQGEPVGMGDAIFCGQDAWADSESIFVVWGDQLHLSEQTIHSAVERHTEAHGPRCTLPLAEVEAPYVQYVFDQDSTLYEIRQTREGDACDPQGYSDVGAFVLAVEGLVEAWQAYLARGVRGAQTGEINFLPFLVFLSQHRRWPFQTVPVADVTECRGINTPEDLEFFLRLYRRASG